MARLKLVLRFRLQELVLSPQFLVLREKILVYLGPGIGEVLKKEMVSVFSKT